MATENIDKWADAEKTDFILRNINELDTKVKEAEEHVSEIQNYLSDLRNCVDSASQINITTQEYYWCYGATIAKCITY
ncbi:hypothetical protein [Cellulosilyticum ruminicola]|uniref:hypothetical protein n=1 Tax=Cellulosilyticum ruminicola TaxID=425254 RepID=UPI0012EE78CB|nr:hypothetical protein [Cellulosilyticum ruminicola]